MSKASQTTGNGASSGSGATMSTRCAPSIAFPASRPSRASLCESLRPIIPAAPTMSTFMDQHPFSPLAARSRSTMNAMLGNFSASRNLTEWSSLPSEKTRGVYVAFFLP